VVNTVIPLEERRLNGRQQIIRRDYHVMATPYPYQSLKYSYTRLQATALILALAPTLTLVHYTVL
jgi:hypothetical protein